MELTNTTTMSGCLETISLTSKSLIFTQLHIIWITVRITMEITSLRHIQLGELHLVKPGKCWIQTLIIRGIDCAAQPTSFVTSPVAMAIQLLGDNHQQDELMSIEHYIL